MSDLDTTWIEIIECLFSQHNKNNWVQYPSEKPSFYGIILANLIEFSKVSLIYQ